MKNDLTASDLHLPQVFDSQFLSNLKNDLCGIGDSVIVEVEIGFRSGKAGVSSGWAECAEVSRAAGLI